MDGLVGKVALVTGAARGQGAAEARLLAARGARVVLTDVLADEGAALAEQIGDAAAFVVLDVTDEAGWARAVGVAMTRFGGLDVLVNNAAVYRREPIETESVEHLRSVLDVNLVGPFLGMQAALPAMRARGGGSIVNVASTAGLQALAGYASYGSAKWGLRGLSRIAALEFGGYGIRVNAVFPGPINTAMLPAPPPGEDPATRFATLALGRAGEPEEVAEVVCFLASDAASYVTGGEFTVDGGSSVGSRPRPRSDD